MDYKIAFRVWCFCKELSTSLAAFRWLMIVMYFNYFHWCLVIIPVCCWVSLIVDYVLMIVGASQLLLVVFTGWLWFQWWCLFMFFDYCWCQFCLVIVSAIWWLLLIVVEVQWFAVMICVDIHVWSCIFEDVHWCSMVFMDARGFS